MLKAVVIGATSGLGRELALVLVDEGYAVGVTGRRAMLLEGLAAMRPGRIVPQAMDLSDPDAAVAALHQLVERLGGMDLLVIAAGIGARNPELAFAPEARVIATNVTGFVAMANAGYAYFSHHGGHLVGISSIAGIRGSRWSPAYGASKAFVSNYLEALRARACHDRLPVAVTDVSPGFVATPMTAGRSGMFWVADASLAALQIARAIRRRRRRVYVTRRWALVAWLLRRLPAAVFERV